MQHVTDALTADERLALEAFLRAQRLHVRLVALFAGTVVFGTLMAGLHAVVEMRIWLTVLLPACGIALWLTSWLASRLWPPSATARRALLHGRKTVTRGVPIAVAPEQPDHVAYRFADGALCLRPLGGFDTGVASVASLPLERRRIRRIEHAPLQPVTVHWIETRPGRGLALRVDYDALGGTRDTIVADPDALARAEAGLRRTVSWLGGNMALAAVVVWVLNGFSVGALGLALAVLGPAYGLMRWCVRGWALRLAKRNPVIEVVAGPVTERVTFQTTHALGAGAGRARGSTQTWCRIGGVFLPRDVAWPAVRLGQRLRVELLRGEGPGGAYRVGSVTEADTPH